MLMFNEHFSPSDTSFMCVTNRKQFMVHVQHVQSAEIFGCSDVNFIQHFRMNSACFNGRLTYITSSCEMPIKIYFPTCLNFVSISLGDFRKSETQIKNNFFLSKFFKGC